MDRFKEVSTTCVGKDIAYAGRCVLSGKLVAIPTETVYGLAANAFDARAVASVYTAKGRPTSLPLILHIASQDCLLDLVDLLPACAAELASVFWPGPLTLILPKKRHVGDFITGGSPRVALRVPRHPLVLRLLEEVNVPLVAPSANPFGYVSPTTPWHVQKHMAHALAYLLDGGPCALGIESTIVGFEQGKPVVYRQGAICVEDLERVVGPVGCNSRSKRSTAHLPGSMKSHYAPRTPLFINIDPSEHIDHPLEKIGVLAFKARWPHVPPAQQMVLSERGNLREAAQNLFGALHALDEMSIQAILAENIPSVGLGRALQDRLLRASYPSYAPKIDPAQTT